MQAAHKLPELVEACPKIRAREIAFRLESAPPEAAFYRGRQRADEWSVGRGQFATFGGEQTFHNDQRRIDRNLALYHHGDQRFHWLGFEVHVLRMAANALDALDTVGTVDHIVGH